MDYFSLLGLTPAFALDPAELEKAYFAQQRAWHPDRFAGKEATEKQQALQRSVDINRAYETLADPLKRAQYLLQLHGIAVGTDNDSIKPSPALLMEVMERQEAIEAEDMPHKLAEELKAAYCQSIEIIATAYAKQAFDAMAQETLRLGYLAKMLVNVDQKLFRARKHVL